MKKNITLIILGVVIAALSSHTARADQTNSAATQVQQDYPIVGMTAIDLAEFLNGIKTRMPVGPKIVGLLVVNENKVVVTTGKVEGPLAGRGERITFERKKGKWEITNREHWIS